MKKYINVGIDVDGIIADFVIPFSKILRYLFKDKIPIITSYDQVLDWDWERWLPLSDTEIEQAWGIVNNSINFWETLPLLNENEWEYLKKNLSSPYINVYFITHRTFSEGKSVVHQTIDWLSSNGWINPQVILAKNKGSVAHCLDLDFFIDDKLSNCVKVKNTLDTCRVYIKNYPYNNNYTITLRRKFDKEFIRVNSLNTFVDDIIKYQTSL